MKLTAHMLIKNEERWVWFAIKAILPYVDSLIVFDTGSTDKTLEIIHLISQQESGKKIKVWSKPAHSRSDLVALRQEMVNLTQTDWFLLVDGDEVWPKSSLKQLIKHLERAPKEIIGAVVRTRNCVGDIYHYQLESAGKYTLKGMTGHLTIRAFRKHKNYSWAGEYPLEGYMDEFRQLLNDQDEKLIFIDTHYYHLTHLKRSNDNDSSQVIDRLKKYKLEIGTKAKEKEIPQVFFESRPKIVPDPLTSYSLAEYMAAVVLTPIKRFIRYIRK